MVQEAGATARIKIGSWWREDLTKKDGEKLGNQSKKSPRGTRMTRTEDA
jgi:hypothetical protein